MTFTFDAAAAGTYYLAARYDSTSVRGQIAPAPPTVHYSFSTNGVIGSTSELDLKPKAAATPLSRPAFLRRLRH